MWIGLLSNSPPGNPDNHLSFMYFRVSPRQNFSTSAPAVPGRGSGAWKLASHTFCVLLNAFRSGFVYRFEVWLTFFFAHQWSPPHPLHWSNVADGKKAESSTLRMWRVLDTWTDISKHELFSHFRNVTWSDCKFTSRNRFRVLRFCFILKLTRISQRTHQLLQAVEVEPGNSQPTLFVSCWTHFAGDLCTVLKFRLLFSLLIPPCWFLRIIMTERSLNHLRSLEFRHSNQQGGSFPKHKLLSHFRDVTWSDFKSASRNRFPVRSSDNHACGTRDFSNRCNSYTTCSRRRKSNLVTHMPHFFVYCWTHYGLDLCTVWSFTHFFALQATVEVSKNIGEEVNH